MKQVFGPFRKIPSNFFDLFWILGDIVKFDTTFHVYTTISGLITILPDGTIHSCNSNFVSTLFGYRQEQLLEKVRSILNQILSIFARFLKIFCHFLIFFLWLFKPIESIIPKFYRETMPIDDGFYPSPSFDDYSGRIFMQVLKKSQFFFIFSFKIRRFRKSFPKHPCASKVRRRII